MILLQSQRNIMQQHKGLKIILTLCGLILTSAASAHPYDEPLTFRKHLTDDGRVIYSNIPKACFSKGVLTCERLHPIFGKPISMKRVRKTKTNITEPVKPEPETPPVEQVKPDPETPQTEQVKAVKLSTIGICHQPGDPGYERTKKVQERFLKIHDCLNAGGRLPKTKRNY